MNRQAAPELVRAINRLDQLFRSLPIEHVRWSRKKRTFYVCFASSEKTMKYVGAAPTLIDALEAAFNSFYEAMANK
jgi:hypothetical protein